MIVSAAVEMTHDAVSSMGDKGYEVGTAAQNGLISILMTVICSDAAVTPTVNVGNDNNTTDSDKDPKKSNDRYLQYMADKAQGA